MNFIFPDFSAIIPEMIILAFACAALLADLFSPRQQKHLAYLLTQVGLAVAAIVTFVQWGKPTVVTFNYQFISDDISRLLKLFIYLTVFGAFYYSRQYLAQRNIPRGEYYVLGLFSTLGMMLLVSSHSFITLFLGLELLSLPLYAMVALQRDSAIASEAAMKYFVMGAIASGMLLYGMSLLYGASGSLDLALVAKSIIQSSNSQSWMYAFALVFIVAGIAFKFAAAPFHMWAPDVYSGSPSCVTLFLSSAPKVAAFGMALRLLVFALPDLFSQWQQLLMVLALFSIVLGNIFAIAQTNLKRMLAYSSIAHIGYMLLGLIAGTQFGYSASLFYILIYALMALAAFGMIVLLSKAGFEAENIEDFKGLNVRNPWLAFLVMLVMFSMAGIPPTIGFISKFLVLKAVIDVGIVWLAVIAVVFAMIGAFYYLRIVKTMYFDAPADASTLMIGRDMQLVISLNGIALLVLGLFPAGLLQACLTALG
ncbi:MAG: NADH-quinone oxidoreductase subunit NuoN [Legionellales bacterium]|nr:NADH-quinone oxidoreductase subunit NuoN [Legionellales bacterium]